MVRCDRCKINIKDDTYMCPLCKHSVANAVTGKKLDGFYIHSYPDIRETVSRRRLLMRIVVLCSIVIEALLCFINYKTYTGACWCVIVGMIFLWACSATGVFCSLKIHRLNKLMYEELMLMLIVLVIDLLCGFWGWSIGIVLPILIVLCDIVGVVLMLVFLKNWQSFIMPQIFLAAVAVIVAVASAILPQASDTFPIIAAGVSVLLFVGTVLIGDRKASSELKRRFRIR